MLSISPKSSLRLLKVCITWSEKKFYFVLSCRATDVTGSIVALAPGELVKDGLFTLFESVAALEVCTTLH